MVCINQSINAQNSNFATISGKILDAGDSSSLIGATIYLKNIRDSTKSKYSVSDTGGNFLIENLEKAFYKLSIRILGYNEHIQLIRIGQDDVDLGTIKLKPDIKILKEVEIKGDVIAVEQKGDTLLYNADAFKVNSDATTKDLISKMPGIVVNNEGVSANGETVQQVLLDGKRFFGQDPLLSLNTIPAEVVKRVELFDQLSEQSQLTGFDDGNTTKTINVVTKEDRRKGIFGRLFSGIGSNSLYTSGGNVNLFNKDRRFTLIGLSNNNNEQNFSNEDLSGIANSGGPRGFRPGPDGPGAGNSGFFTGIQNGITSTNSAGLNYSDNLGKKGTFESSYFYNQSNNDNKEHLNRETYLTDAIQSYYEEKETLTKNNNHRFNSRITYSLNDRNKLITNPSISFQDNNSLRQTNGITSLNENQIQTNNEYESENNALNIDNNILFQHRFLKIGRSLSIESKTKINLINRENIYSELASDSIIQFFSDENTIQLKGEVRYMEPVGNTGQLSIGYSYDAQNRLLDKNAYVDDSDNLTLLSTLSNELESHYNKHTPFINFANRSFRNLFDIGLSYQYASLKNVSDNIIPKGMKREFHSVLPVFMGRVDLPGGGDLFFRYAGNTSAPSAKQLQNIYDISNPLFLSIGNPDLKQSYTHSLMLRASKSNLERNTSLANFTRIENARNYISQSTYVNVSDTLLQDDIVASQGTQISTPINVNGYWNITNSTTHSFLISQIQSNLNTSLSASYRRTPGITNGFENISNNFSASTRVGLVSHITEYFDFNIFYDFSANIVRNSLSESIQRSKYSTQTLGSKIDLTIGKTLVLRSDLTHQAYKGISDTSDINFTLWNFALAKKFLKNNQAEIELSVFDLLNQNRGISQNVGPNYLEETTTEVLRQYFMFKLTYQIRKFK